MEIAKIQQLIEPYVDLQLECDGMTKVISYVLKQNDIDHKVMIGDIGTIHLWIEIDDYIIDYRLRMWMGEKKEIPHGIFKREDYPNATWYEVASEIDLKMNELFFRVLTMKS
jgi:hypothetical protein